MSNKRSPNPDPVPGWIILILIGGVIAFVFGCYVLLLVLSRIIPMF